jgi:hypothetical protein
MRKLLILLLLLSAQTSFAQRAPRPEWKKYSWEEDRKPYTLTDAEKKKSAIVLKDHRIIEIFFDGEGAKSEANTYYTKHVIVRVNSDNAIEEYNKVYIPMLGVTEVVDLQARFISKEGKVITFDKSHVKDVENYDNHGPYKIFALEGVELGGEVEYIYTVKKPFRMFGTEMYRSSYDYREISLDIVAPSHLKYDAKSYNGLPNPEEMDRNDDKNGLHFTADSIPGFEDEVYSSQDASYPRVEYKLAYNLSNSRKKRLYTWNDAADAYFKVVNDATSSEKRMCEALYQRMDISSMDNEEKKIRKIESYMKTHFTVRKDAEGDRYERITGILQFKLASQLGIMRVYYALFEVAGIRQEIVMTSDRFNKQFDGDFDSWTYLQNFLLYFPDTKGFIAPTETFYRYGFAPPSWCAQDGLFIRAVSLGGEVSGVGTVKEIGTTDWQQSISGLYANISLNFEERKATLHAKQSYTGYSAAFIQPFYSFMSAEDRRETMEEIVKNSAEDAKPKNLRVTGYNSEDTLYNLPFAVEADYTTNTLIEYACGHYIFKVGEVIGPQVEMYQTQQRRTDMVLANPHGFHREIRFDIPAGYRVTNLEALNMNVAQLDKDSVPTMEFKSSYRQEENTVIVTVEENYRKTFYPKSVYDDFRNVINASADFNKIVVYFEKLNG